MRFSYSSLHKVKQFNKVLISSLKTKKCNQNSHFCLSHSNWPYIFFVPRNFDFLTCHFDSNFIFHTDIYKIQAPTISLIIVDSF